MWQYLPEWRPWTDDVWAVMQPSIYAAITPTCARLPHLQCSQEAREIFIYNQLLWYGMIYAPLFLLEWMVTARVLQLALQFIILGTSCLFALSLIHI